MSGLDEVNVVICPRCNSAKNKSINVGKAIWLFSRKKVADQKLKHSMFIDAKFWLSRTPEVYESAYMCMGCNYKISIDSNLGLKLKRQFLMLLESGDYYTDRSLYIADMERWKDNVRS